MSRDDGDLSSDSEPTRLGAQWRVTLAAVAVFVGLCGSIIGVRGAITTPPLDVLTATGHGDGTTTYSGSWWFPRGGPYVLGFESPNGDATLRIGRRVIASGSGQKTRRVVFERGAVDVELKAPPGSRLLWHPPGRRGPLEYVPASSLSAAPSADASFSDGVGASRTDGIFAALLLAALIGLVGFFARRSIADCEPSLRWAVLAVVVLACLVRLYDLGGAGQTWDEDVNWSAGRNYVTNILSLDFEQSSWLWNYQHPPIMKYIAGVGAQFADGYNPSRGLSALAMALACGLLVVIGRRLFSLRVGIFAGLVACLLPPLIAHGKIVGHEAPTALWWMLGLWVCLIAHEREDRRGETVALAKSMAVVGVVLGIAVMSRFVNVLLAPLMGLVLLAYAPREQRARTVALGLAVIPAAALLVSFVVWPRLWTQPVAHMIEAWQTLRQPHSPEPFLGHITNSPPRYYFLAYLGATAPVGVLLAAVGGAVALARQRNRPAFVVLAWMVVPLIVMLSPVRQDGVRYIIPCLFAMAMMAAVGLDWLCARLAERLPRGTTWAVGTVTVAYLVVVSWRIHPYYLDYYGEHVGGPSSVAANKQFELPWWGEGIHDAIGYVNRHAEPGARVHKKCVEPQHLTWLRGDLWATEAKRVDDADWVVVYQPTWRGCPLPPGFKLVHRVDAQGAPIALVYRRD